MSSVAFARDLNRSFGEIQAVKNLNLNLEQGEIYGLIGPDGAGKTTTFRLLTGALDPDSGEIEIGGLDVKTQAEKVRERIGYMPQLFGLYSDLTVKENLLFFGRLFGVEKKKLNARIRELLNFVRLKEFEDRRAGNLSGGMYKKLAIACSILHEPRLLILDEPTNGVDPVSRRDLWALLFSVAHEGVTVLVSTPYMDEAERCHRTGLLFRGKLALEGEPRDLLLTLSKRLFLIRCEELSEVKRRLMGLDRSRGFAYASPEGMRLIVRNQSDFPSLERAIHTELRGMKFDFEAIAPTFEDIFMEIQWAEEG